MSVSKPRDFGISYSSQNPLRVPSETRQPSQEDFFRHAALEDDKKFIRLVQILPDLTDNGLIQLSLRDFLFDSRDQVDGTHTSRVAPTYSCLSYTWGVRSKDMTIHLNEKPFQIRRNLWQYLAEVRTQIANHGELRRPDVERYIHSERLRFLANPLTNCNLFLWIDALCIDQTNDTEKGHQVQWMGEIYANADMVMIWLGITGYDESVLQTKVQKRPRTDWQEGRFLLKMITSDYWSRAWITQELLLAICPVFLTQSGLHSFGTVGKLLQPDSIANPRLDVLSLLDTYATPPGTHKSSDIVSLLHRLNGSKKKCMNVLDRVYSLLALSEHGHKIEVDYTISSTELASRVLLASKKALCFCSVATIAGTLDLPAKIPECASGFYMDIWKPRSRIEEDHDRRCKDCLLRLPAELEGRQINILCLANVCPKIVWQGHLYAPALSLPSNLGTTNEVVLYCKSSLSTKSVCGVSVSVQSSNEDQTYNIWRINLHGMVSIARSLWAEDSLCARGGAENLDSDQYPYPYARVELVEDC